MTDDEYDDLFRSTYPRLVAMGLAMSTSRHVSQELAQETMLRAHHHRDELDAYDSPIAWCRRVMGNLLIDHHRSRSSEAAAIERLGHRESSHDDRTPDPATVAASIRWADLTRSLSPQQRLAATLYYAEDHSVADVAEIMDIATGT
ncbi:MAG: sigma-70 family RNA polymerase sigma factor, partial [Ilumatobacter sp.]